MRGCVVTKKQRGALLICTTGLFCAPIVAQQGFRVDNYGELAVHLRETRE
jgi:hypothetical protein